MIFAICLLNSLALHEEVCCVYRVVGDWSTWLWNFWRIMWAVQNFAVIRPMLCGKDLHCIWSVQLRLLHVLLSGLADTQFSDCLSSVCLQSWIGICYFNRSTIRMDLQGRVQVWFEEVTANMDWTGKVVVPYTEKVVCLPLLRMMCYHHVRFGMFTPVAHDVLSPCAFWGGTPPTFTWPNVLPAVECAGISFLSV